FGENLNRLSARLGAAPYEAEYDELASWFMIQADWLPKAEETTSITPLIRIFYRSFMMESGVSLKGNWMFNFMFHY
ncbi:MAG: hypothetical protein M9962_15335, partial [Oligoflexia bacterium]|nr:hypothetical protein [Oligoflexia bacterium]